MKCAICNRPLDKAFLMIGNQPIGPKCAEKKGLKPEVCKVGVRIAYKNTHIDSNQLDIFEQGENGEI